MKFISKLFGVVPSAQVVNAALETIYKETAMADAKRNQAKARMKSFGRSTLLEGGEFSLKNRVLQSHNK